MGIEHTFCVILQVKTGDPRLSKEALAEALESGTAGDFARLRRLILHALPRDVERLVALFPVEHARMLMMLHEMHGKKIAEHLRKSGIDDEELFLRPPPDYVPPTRG